jgi:TRAP-type C4-dicarboxylate transport system substrate-binding protein
MTIPTAQRNETGGRRPRLPGVLAALAACLAAAGARPARAEPQVWKIATLAPEGSSWMKLFHEWRTGIERRTGGQVKLKFYAGGVAGDERDFVRKMRLGQMNGAAITAVGLGLIQPDVRLLEAPFLFRDDAELDHVRGALDAEFRKRFDEKGYVLIAWGDVGPVRLFSNAPLKTRADLAKVKMWVWNDDPLMQRLLTKMGFVAVPLGVPDVLPSLQTGVIDGTNGSPLAAVALQWHARVKYVTSLELSQSVGAVVVTKKAWDALGADARTAVTDESRNLGHKLVKLVRYDNAAALKKIRAQGIEVVPTPEPLVKEFIKESLVVRGEFEGKLWSRELRERVEQILKQKRGP